MKKMRRCCLTAAATTTGSCCQQGPVKFICFSHFAAKLLIIVLSKQIIKKFKKLFPLGAFILRLLEFTI